MRDWLAADDELLAWWVHNRDRAGLLASVPVRAAILDFCARWMDWPDPECKAVRRTHCRYTGPYYSP